MTHPELYGSQKKTVASLEQIAFLQEELGRGAAYALLALEFKGRELPYHPYRKQARAAHDFAVHILTAISIPEGCCQKIHTELCTLWLLLEELGEWEEVAFLPSNPMYALSFCKN